MGILFQMNAMASIIAIVQGVISCQAFFCIDFGVLDDQQIDAAETVAELAREAYCTAQVIHGGTVNNLNLITNDISRGWQDDNRRKDPPLTRASLVPLSPRLVAGLWSALTDRSFPQDSWVLFANDAGYRHPAGALLTSLPVVVASGVLVNYPGAASRPAGRRIEEKPCPVPNRPLWFQRRRWNAFAGTRLSEPGSTSPVRP